MQIKTEKTRRFFVVVFGLLRIQSICWESFQNHPRPLSRGNSPKAHSTTLNGLSRISHLKIERQVLNLLGSGDVIPP
jgi:hypothetical protein